MGLLGWQRLGECGRLGSQPGRLLLASMAASPSSRIWPRSPLPAGSQGWAATLRAAPFFSRGCLPSCSCCHPSIVMLNGWSGLGQMFPLPSHPGQGQIINTMTGAHCALWESVPFFFSCAGPVLRKMVWSSRRPALPHSQVINRSPQCESVMHLAVLSRKSLRVSLVLSWPRLL